MAMFSMLLVGLARALVAFLYFPADLPIFLPHSLLKVAGVSPLFSYQQLIQAIAGDSGHGLAENEELDMYLDRKKLNPDPVVHHKLKDIMHTGCSVTNHLMMEV